MDNTHFSNKCTILFQLSEMNLEGTWDNFFQTYDLGVPLARMVHYGVAIPTEEGTQVVEEAWEQMCEIFGVDKYGRYESIYELVDMAQNE